MKKYILLILTVLLSDFFFAQSTRISLKKAIRNNFDLRTTVKDPNVLELNVSLSYISSVTTSTNVKIREAINYITVESDGLMKTFDAGKPEIPVYSKLIELPLDATVQFNIIGYDEEIIDLKAQGITKKVVPAQPSVSKSEEPNTSYYDRNIYNANKYFNTQIADFEDVGIMRSTRLGRIIINPIQYNPVQNKLRVLNNLKIEILFVGSNGVKTQQLKSKYSNKSFDNLVKNYIRSSAIQFQTASVVKSSEKETYVIVSDRMFEASLSPFISHKRSIGYNVIVGYTDSPDVGITTTSIKAYLNGLYTNPPNGYNPPLYVLLVGDVEQIPSFNGTTGEHVTDLYYFDYTNDNIPDVFYGRFSAQNTAQLIPQMNKTLEYEKYSMPDPSYLFNAVLVAGNDSYWINHANGQVNYIKKEYCNFKNGISANAYLQPEPNGANYSANIISNINSGVGLANYTAHCNENGWSNPRFSKDQIASLNNNHKYGLWIGNCCLSNKFDISECFGEAALRAPNKGAVGYIGATNLSYWNEDFWWSVGFKTISTNPNYDPNSLGAYDKLFHTHGEVEFDWYSNQGQLVIGGNLAVQESNSSRKKYYWEIYHLLGDPSLNIKFVPSTSCEEDLIIDTNIFGGDYNYLADNTITASNTISDNARVHFGANVSVILSGGFNVEVGSALTIDGNGCSNNDNLMAKNQNGISVENSESLNEKESFEYSEDVSIRVYPDPLLENTFIIEIDGKKSIPKSVIVSGTSGSNEYNNSDNKKLFVIKGIIDRGDISVIINIAEKFIVKKINI